MKPGNHVNLEGAIGKRIAALKNICGKYAAEAEQYAKDYAEKIGPGPNHKGNADNKKERPVVFTDDMLAEREKKKDMGDRSEWTRATGDAAKMLKGYVIDDGENLGFGIAHRESYGAYLEYANSGKHAILRPTLEHFRADFFAAAHEIMGDA